MGDVDSHPGGADAESMASDSSFPAFASGPTASAASRGYDFSGRVVVVTGASQGIGAGLATTFAAAGAKVVIVARRADRLEAVAAQIRSRGGEAVVLAGDVTEEATAQAAVSRALELFGRLDVAVNNATDGPLPALLADIDSAEFERGLATNLHGTFYGMKHQIPAMIGSGGGCVVNLASVAALMGVSHLSAYVAAKAGIIGLSRTAALDYADRNVRVNVVAPGPILTEDLAAAGERARQGAAAAVPMGRVGAVSDVTAAVLWLCSDAASFVTGATLPVDGGQSAGFRLQRPYQQGKPLD
jgi:NAD(P)-dependent dehydrogenase (short-subunit alcohol dehydrogenase family)